MEASLSCVSRIAAITRRNTEPMVQIMAIYAVKIFIVVRICDSQIVATNVADIETKSPSGDDLSLISAGCADQPQSWPQIRCARLAGGQQVYLRLCGQPGTKSGIVGKPLLIP